MDQKESFPNLVYPSQEEVVWTTVLQGDYLEDNWGIAEITGLARVTILLSTQGITLSWTWLEITRDVWLATQRWGWCVHVISVSWLDNIYLILKK